MFKKILVANRGEIAVRVVRTCREMGLATVALYQEPDRHSLHVRLADECVPLVTPAGFMDGEAILAIARERGVDAIHPGYGYLAEEADFIRACQAAGVTFIGPPAPVVAAARDKLGALARVRAAGYAAVNSCDACIDADDPDALAAAAAQLEYPLVIKSCQGGRGPGERLVRRPESLMPAARRAQAESLAVFGRRQIYLEEAILPAHQVAVQVLGDVHGQIIHLGDREGSLQVGNRKIVEESPSPSLSRAQRQRLCQTAVAIARLFAYQGAGTVEFLVDAGGAFYFTEIKARLQVEHPLTEMMARVDLVREQLRIAAGEQLDRMDADDLPPGWSMLCRVAAEDPWNHNLPSAGVMESVRLPGGPEVRVDTYIYPGCPVPAAYDPLIAKLAVWAPGRQEAMRRMQRALEDFKLAGTPTNLPLLQRVFQSPAFLRGVYTTDLLPDSLADPDASDEHLRDLAAAVALLYLKRTALAAPTQPERLQRGWHRRSRRLPQ